MTLPSISISKINGSASPLNSGANKALVIGPAAGVSATVKETTIYTISNPNSVASTIGYGSAQEQAEIILKDAPTGFAKVDIIVSSGSIAPEVTEVTAASPTIDISNVTNARMGLDIVTTVTKAGARGAGKFKYSLDGGITNSSDILIPSDGQFTFTNTGVSCSFATGTHAVGNESRYSIKGPRMTTTDLASCINTISNSNSNYTYVVIADDNDDPVSASALFTAMNTHLTTLANSQFKHTQAIVPVGGETKLFNRTFANTNGSNPQSTVRSNMSSKAVTAGNGIMAVAEKVNTLLANPFIGLGKPRRAFSFVVAGAAHGVGSDISRNPSKTALFRASNPSYDERRDGSVYDDDRIVAPARGLPGDDQIYLNNSHNKYDASGDSYDIIYKNRVVNRGAEIAKSAMQKILLDNIVVLNDGTGRGDPGQLSDYETVVRKQLDAALLQPTNLQGTKGYCSAYAFTIDRENDILSTSTLICYLSILPFASARTIELTISLDAQTVTL